MPDCRHERLQDRSRDVGRCSETGYHDAENLTECLDCGAVFTDEEMVIEMESIQRELANA